MPKNAAASYRVLARTVLQRAELFVHLAKPTLDRMCDSARLLSLQSGEALFHSGDRVDALTVVIDGALDVSTIGSSGKRHVVMCLEPGQITNLIPVLDDLSALHDVHAHGQAIVMQLPKQEVLQAIDDEPGLARALIRLLCLRSRALYGSVAHAALLPLRARCAKLLLSLMVTYGREEDGAMLIALKLSQEDLADMLGCTRQSVNRELKLFEREGVLRMSYSQFVVLDAGRLGVFAQV